MAPLTAGAIAIAAVAVVCFFVFTKANPFADPYVVRAAFTNIDRVRPGSPVRTAGIEVGRVTATEPGPDGRSSVLVMEIRDKGLPLHRDARFKVRARIFLEGNYFVDLQPGSAGEPELPDGSLVPATQTASFVSAGDLLRVFQRDAREDLRTVLEEFGTALSGGGARAFNRTTPYLEPVFREGARINEAARGASGRDLSAYVRAAARVAEGLSRDTPRLQELVANVATTAGALAREQAALQSTIDELPRTLRQGTATLGRVNEAFPDVRRLAAELTPVVRRSPATLDAALPFVRELRGLVGRDELGGLARDLRRAAPPLARFTRGNIELQGLQRLLASCQNGVVLPTTSSTVPDARFPASGPAYEEIVKWFPGVAGGGRNFDANLLYSRTMAPSGNFIYPVGTRFFYNTQPLEGINPAPSALPPFRPDVPCETQEPPDLRSNPLPPPREINALPLLRRGLYQPEAPSKRELRRALG